ncbi:SDR family oxidoreductase [Mucilaginibacter lappiensis]|uniref:NAD(P)-dependent dehydrogenase (Short-subunit alcohol dehydrogenase family) n=1 Tax=Mucilaginibacter lappiensis TaxID=354630 RepID=A0A841JA11_9SPHI|nr:SDR family oxidoreductase [Mucilaginibacter lappiensis]MBB6127192.1 NAD(P)-dependent dehydrogenase (short-subunit alcohol dehydrogenase family) [Mucilaginibacter lappiensis]
MKKQDEWTIADITPQMGKYAVVTGASGGLGFEISLQLAKAGAEVVLAARDQFKGEEAIKRILQEVPGAKLHFEKLDLASLSSVKDFTDRLIEYGKQISVLINNAGVSYAERQVTSDGFEADLGINHLGHFALTGRLLPLLKGGARVVVVTSGANRRGKINFDDLQSEKKFTSIGTYAQSKLANLMFAIELQRRSAEYGYGLQVIAAHPGYARTELVKNSSEKIALLARLAITILSWLGQSAAEGAWPALFAATSPKALAGGYYGPGGFAHLSGPVTEATIPDNAQDTQVSHKLWQVSEELTKVKWPISSI